MQTSLPESAASSAARQRSTSPRIPLPMRGLPAMNSRAMSRYGV